MFVWVMLVASAARAEPDVELFTREGCPHCADAKAFLEGLVRELPGLVVLVREVDRDEAALERLRAVARDGKIAVLGLPTMVVRGQVLVGFDDAATSGARVRVLLEGGPRTSEAGEGEGVCGVESACDGATPATGPPRSEVDTTFGAVSVEELGLPVFTLVIGLIDGFNPCAMWVLLFLLSMLVNLKDRRRMAIIAATFVAASGVVYFAADDALMVTIAIVTMDKTRLTERGGRWLKLVSGLVMLLLGLALVFFPEALF